MEFDSEASEPPHPNPLPSGEREFIVPASAESHGKRSRSRGASWRLSVCLGAMENGSRANKYDHINCETGSVQGKGRGGACLSVFRYAGFVVS
jgi:hypothetical protein